MIFANTGIKITCDGTKHLGACIGDESFGVDEIKEFARIARIHPHMQPTSLYSRSTAQICLHHENYKQH